MSPSPRSPMVRRALQTAEIDANANATTSLLPGVARCASSTLASAASGDAEKTCGAASGFSFFELPAPPTAAQTRAMCAEDACHKTVDAIQRAMPLECQLANGGAPTYLYRDVIEPVATTCSYSRRMDASSGSGSRSSSSSSGMFPIVGDRSADSVHPPVQSTESAAPSVLTAGPIVALIGGAILCGFLAAFVRSQLQRRRQDQVKISEDSRSRPPSDGRDESIVAPLEDIDEFYSQHAEFTAIAVSSKVSSNQSRASTSRSSKHSVGSYTDAELAIVEYSPHDAKRDAFEDPALVMLRIPMSKIHVGELISLGGFGQVYAGTYDRQLPIAIKTLLPERCLDARKVELFLGEAKLLARLNHERIERLVGVAWDTSERDPWMLTEFVGGGDLRGLLNQFATERRLVGFSVEKVTIALHVAEALQYLHSLSPGVLHLDLKSRNVLLTPQWDAVLTSIGCQRERDSRPKAGASLWTAPEIIVGERFDEKADMFSFGVLLSEIDTHDLPYALARDWDDRVPQDTVIHEQVWRGELCVSFSERADPDLVAIGKACISVNPRHRPTAEELYERMNHVMQSYVAFV